MVICVYNRKISAGRNDLMFSTFETKNLIINLQ